MEDVWVWDKNRPTRMIPRAEVYTSSDVTVEELRGEGEEPTLTPEALAKRIGDLAPSTKTSRPAGAPVLLAVDVGNTQTVFGLFDGAELRDHWRLATDRERTGDELGVLHRRRWSIPTTSRRSASRRRCRSSCARTTWSAGGGCARRSSSLGPGVRTGIPIRYDDPREVGPDRIVNAVAALERYGAPCIVVDFGTSTNFDVVSAEGEYVGGVLAPGDRDLDGRAVRPRGAAVHGRRSWSRRR